MTATTVVAVLHTIDPPSDGVGVESPHILAVVRVLIIYKGQKFSASCNIKQVTGSQANEQETIEVSELAGYDGPIDWNAFADGAQEYYKLGRGASGSATGLGEGSSAAMSDSSIQMPPKFLLMDCEDEKNHR